MREILKTTVDGHVQIIDNTTGKVLIDKHNAIHPANMATAIARGLANSPNSQIYKIKLGNQGTYIDGTQQIIFRPPITTGSAANLYNATYAEIVDDTDIRVGVGNSVTMTNMPASTNARVIITSVISSNEAVNRPTDQSGPSVNPEGQFFFDELGLFTQETSGTLLNGIDELMLSHLIMSPIEHTGNRELTIIYTLTISVS
ncbi:MAG: hypothetical protein DDT31_00017 [Syntrophomonadaceae bacterium]|nr:hypothetical protein [Bacillota bacterium]